MTPGSKKVLAAYARNIALGVCRVSASHGQAAPGRGRLCDACADRKTAAATTKRHRRKAVDLLVRIIVVSRVVLGLEAQQRATREGGANAQ